MLTVVAVCLAWVGVSLALGVVWGVARWAPVRPDAAIGGREPASAAGVAVPSPREEQAQPDRVPSV